MLIIRKGKRRQRENEKGREARDQKVAVSYSFRKEKVKGLCRQQAGDLVNLYLSCKQCQTRNQQAS